ncbi:MAG: hypothetical protein JWP27_381 [Flaviaesturariibacter sp.]|nr:hypothetical protein [Flaviaesturariibacter sp.]
MCGIAGIISSPDKLSLQRLRKMTDRIAHRGPDGEGQWISEKGTAGLAHRRLSIIDLTEAGHQPMHYLGRYTITFNGEIYNYVEIREQLEKKGYRFQSHTDTEVLMALYDLRKEDCLPELDGMFAFAIWDEQEQTLFCARDRFGEKPFFYHYEAGKEFSFASEMKALWAGGTPKTVDPVMLYSYLNTGSVFDPTDPSHTFYAGIRKLKAGHYIRIDRQLGLQEKRYWELCETSPWTGSFEDACDRFRELFDLSTARRLRADVPVGSSLSGGLDSSLVVCTIDEIRKRENRAQVQKTFSARFPGFAKDEGRYMQMVSEKTDTEPHFVFPDDKMLLEEFDRLTYHQEEPFGSASIFVQYCVMRLAKENNVTVLLDGQGADELLAGYHFYFRKYFSEIRRQPRYAAELSGYKNLHNPSKATLQRLWGEVNLRPLMALPIRVKRMMVKPEHATKAFLDAGRRPDRGHDDSRTLNESLIFSSTRGPLEELLRYADRNSMAHSREVRLPFLFHELAEFLINVPASYKIKDGWTKYIMRAATAGRVPEEIVWRKDKIGYEPPQESWMAQDSVRGRIADARQTLVSQGVLEKSILSREIKAAAAAGGANSASWKHWMAANLYTKP